MNLQKDPRVRLPKLLKAARGQECQFNIAWVCNHNPETTVACHKNGAGAGMKAHDFKIAFGCSACHDWYDGRTKHGDRVEYREAVFDQANDRTLAHCFREGILKC